MEWTDFANIFGMCWYFDIINDIHTTVLKQQKISCNETLGWYSRRKRSFSETNRDEDSVRKMENHGRRENSSIERVTYALKL